MPAAIAGRWSAGLAGHELHAPSLLWSEASATLRQLEWRGEVRRATVTDAIAWLMASDIKPTLSRELMSAARQVAHDLGWAKTYDAEYVVLAQRLGVALATLDVRLSRSASALVDLFDLA